MSSILVIEDEKTITSLLMEKPGLGGCQVTMLLNGSAAVEFALREIPSLIIIDFASPGIDGYALVEELRDLPKCMHIPVIAISDEDDLDAKVRAYEVGVDCYLVHPYAELELLVLVRRQLRRVQQASLSPLTQLPGGLQLEQAIDDKLRSMQPWSILYLDLDNFKAFNDVYGFLIGNDMIQLLSRICQSVVYQYGNSDDFVGHIGGDDFLIVTTPDRDEKLCKEILRLYQDESQSLYRQEDLERGKISGIDRNGKPCEFPLVTLSIGVVRDQRSAGIDEIGSLTAAAKCGAKRSSDSVFEISPRKKYSLDHCSCSSARSSVLAFAQSGTMEQKLRSFIQLDGSLVKQT
uniref:Diguanylate cyclase response regulator n=1 Tax=Thermosporothrix sp. COM3 TaxID=2490863 RepID=A0A455SMP2_9CHLR|nr:hypothetical protein KTC_34190 [Thermosporothrix sp. COM3]